MASPLPLIYRLVAVSYFAWWRSPVSELTLPCYRQEPYSMTNSIWHLPALKYLLRLFQGVAFGANQSQPFLRHFG